MFNMIRYLFGCLRKAYLLFVHDMKLMKLRLKGAQIGKETWILVDLFRQAGIKPDRLKIGNSCVICADTVFTCGDGYGILLKRDSSKERFDDGITIHDNCFIGTGAVILNGLSIGPNAIVGAGAVVFADVRPNTCVAGNPARYICDTEAYARISEKNLIKGYREMKKRNLNKSDFLVAHFWKQDGI